MDIRETQCRSILTRTGGYLREVASHSLNPYTGCGFGHTLCGVGCYVQTNPWVMRGRAWGGFLDVKSNAAEVYRRTAGAERNRADKRGELFSIFMSSATEPWQPAERKYRVTRSLLAAMRESPPHVLILQTHTDAILEDIEVIADLSQQCSVRIHLSIETDRETLPGLPPPPVSVEARLQAVNRLAERGLTTVVCLSPLLPLQEPESFFQKITGAGASAVVVDHFIGGDGTADGSRTLQTPLPNAIREIDPDALTLAYRDRVVSLARQYLPTGVSAAGFAGHYD